MDNSILTFTDKTSLPDPLTTTFVGSVPLDGPVGIFTFYSFLLSFGCAGRLMQLPNPSGGPPIMNETWKRFPQEVQLTASNFGTFIFVHEADCL